MERPATLLPPDTLTRGAQPGEDRPAELDRETLALAQRGDEHACRALVTRYQDVVFANLSRVLGPRGQQNMVPDLAQDTFLRVFRELRWFSPEGPGRLSSWIVTIAVRLALDELKRRKLDVLAPDEVAARLRDRRTTDQGVQHSEAAATVERALDALGPGLRAVLLLRVVEELPYEDISRQLGIEIGTVKSRLARARATLWQALAAGDRE
jgi:RNA polymerase sigma-70 factor (ECF subfamily)